jgi:hypothetical protein
MLAFAALILVHLAIAAGVLLEWDEVSQEWLHVAVIWLAIVALGSPTLEEGLQLSREIERYEDYRAAVFDARSQFDHARTNEERVHAMIEMERISFDEMRSFLRTASETSFLL